MGDISFDKWVRQGALLTALLCVGLSLSSGVTLATCSVRFALVYCVTLLVGRVALQVWQWSVPHSSDTASGKHTLPTETPVEQGGTSA